MTAFKNPIIFNDINQQGKTADPYVIFHEGYYYHCYATDEGIFISCSKQLCDIGNANAVKVFDVKEIGLGAWYAPELHNINGKWYIYAAPEYENGLHVMTVLEGKAPTPICKYVNLGRIRGLEHVWSIDGTILTHNNKLYLIYAHGDENGSGIHIIRLSDPVTTTGKNIELCIPEYEFETKCGLINEGPAIIKRGKKIHVVYSANNSDTDDYCLGLLTYNGNGDILDASNWNKTKHTVFDKTDTIFGPGHCSFTTVTEGENTSDYIVYHANLESGSGWHGRNVFAQGISWDKNDMPVFGKPHI